MQCSKTKFFIFGGLAILVSAFLLVALYFRITKKDDSLIQKQPRLMIAPIQEEMIVPIQEELNEVAAAKIMGDAIMAGKSLPGTSLPRTKLIAEMVAGRLKFMVVPKELQDYQQSAIAWSQEIDKAADNTETWKELSKQPRDFKLKLSDKQAKELLQKSLGEITKLKGFGDEAIKRKDRTAMAYIAAKLIVQQHWLDAILHSEKAEPTPFSLIPFALAYETEIREICAAGGGQPLTVNGHVWCAGVVSSANDVAYTAVDYATAQEGAEEAWKQTTDDLFKQVPPDFQGHLPNPIGDFTGECQAKGGIAFVGSGGNIPKTGLPTIENGDTCEYHIKDKDSNDIACWDFLTYSGGRYMGGSEGCEEKNLLPKEYNEEKTQELGGKWDGEYTIPAFTISCSDNFPFTMPVPEDVGIIRNNVVVGDNVSVPINGDTAIYNNSLSQQIETSTGNILLDVSEIDVVRFYQEGDTTRIYIYG